MRYSKNDGGRCEVYGIAPLKKNLIGDCVIRAIAIGLNQSYKQTLKDLCEMSIEQGGIPNDEWIYEQYLTDKGWVKCKPPRDANGRKIRLKDWHHSRAIVLLCGHLTTVIGDCVLDTFDPSEYYCNSYYTPKELA